MRAVTDVPGMPSAEELSALPHDELAVRLAEAYQLIGRLQARVEELERQVRQDSPASSLRMTSQCFCMNNTPGRDGCMAIRWTQ